MAIALEAFQAKEHPATYPDGKHEDEGKARYEVCQKAFSFHARKAASKKAGKREKALFLEAIAHSAHGFEEFAARAEFLS